ncbi:MAG: ferrous iron transport protein B [Pyrinomonadaceae bacterium]|nr:ferrous iron transport protein B [Pyrinomonadaceae bacterium]
MTDDSKVKKSKTKGFLNIALAGNPNAGKTTLFNALTGMRQKVANYSGVTVERKEGTWRINEAQNARLIDLPGLYSLDALSLDEQIARDVLTGNASDVAKPDVVLAVVDATNIERNLYLVTQLLDYKLPLVIALTMFDEIERSETKIDVAALSEKLGVPIVPIVARQKRGLDELSKTILEAAKKPFKARTFPFSQTKNGAGVSNIPNQICDIEEPKSNSQIFARYAWISDVVQDSVIEKNTATHSLSEKIDGLLTHKVFGLLILALILLLVFQAIFSWATLPMDLLNAGFDALNDFTRENLPAGLLTDLLTDGIIHGVGSVLVFLPQIALLFFFISILEDTGYMARAAFLLDKVMSSVGLHGKAFVPLLSSFACAIPGVMATRTIENPKDRLATIMIAPLMSCSARLPVYTLMIGAFFTGQYAFGFISVGAILILSMYVLGIVTAIVVAFILKRTILKSPAPPLVMELPPYRMPRWNNVFLNVWQSSKEFVKRAGTVILAISIIMWALANFPRVPVATVENQSQIVDNKQLDDEAQKEFDKKAETEAQNKQLEYSIAGRLGKIIEPVITPLGYDWKIGIALISSFAAREVFVSSMSILYDVGGDETEESDSLLQAIRDAKRDDGTPVWSPLLALSTMVFYLLAFQCMSTFSIVRRETNSWAWTFFMVFYMTGLAYIASFITYQGGKLLGF